MKMKIGMLIVLLLEYCSISFAQNFSKLGSIKLLFEKVQNHVGVLNNNHSIPVSKSYRIFNTTSDSTQILNMTNSKSVFISANLGVYIVAQDQFDRVYDSNMGFMPSVEVGLPVSTRTYLYGKISYFLKRGVPIFYQYELQNGNFVLVSETKDGSASFKEWIFNAGLLYNIFLTEEYTLGINGGLTFVSLSEERNSTVFNSVKYSGGGLLGFFGGLMVERNFNGSPFSLTCEIAYNLSRGDIKTFVGNYGGFNTNLGVRYYFKERRRN